MDVKSDVVGVAGLLSRGCRVDRGSAVTLLVKPCRGSYSLVTTTCWRSRSELAVVTVGTGGSWGVVTSWAFLPVVGKRLDGGIGGLLSVCEDADSTVAFCEVILWLTVVTLLGD